MWIFPAAAGGPWSALGMWIYFRHPVVHFVSIHLIGDLVVRSNAYRGIPFYAVTRVEISIVRNNAYSESQMYAVTHTGRFRCTQ